MSPLSLTKEKLEEGYEVLLNGRRLEDEQFTIADGQIYQLVIKQIFSEILKDGVEQVGQLKYQLKGLPVGGVVNNGSRDVPLHPKAGEKKLGHGVNVVGTYR